MKVKDLIEKLKKLDGGLEVLCYSEDESLIGDDNGVKALDIVDVTETKLSVSRSQVGKVELSFSGTGSDRSFALVEITADL
ncbi:MAG: hypothetical protein P1U57_11665 [Oleibacter sp.]|nr:hypothetical protein [Thalassolituus sp.]